MRIEEEIKQDKFKDDLEKTLVNILYTSSWLQDKNLQILKPYKLSVQQYNVLRILRGQYPKAVSIGLIADRMLDKNSNASRLIDKLLLKKMVKREVCETDRRQRDISITETGLKTLSDVDEQMPQLSRMVNTLTSQESQQLNDLLDKLRDI